MVDCKPPVIDGRVSYFGATFWTLSCFLPEDDCVGSKARGQCVLPIDLHHVAVSAR